MKILGFGLTKVTGSSSIFGKDTGVLLELTGVSCFKLRLVVLNIF